MNGSSNRIHMDGLRLRAGTLTWAGFPGLKRFRKGIVAVSGEIALLQCAKPRPNPPPQAGEGQAANAHRADENMRATQGALQRGLLLCELPVLARLLSDNISPATRRAPLPLAGRVGV